MRLADTSLRYAYQKKLDRIKSMGTDVFKQLTTEISIKAVTPIEVGTNVIRLNNGAAFGQHMFGMPYEDLGVVEETIILAAKGSKAAVLYARVNYPIHGEVNELVDNIIAYPDFLSWCKESGYKPKEQIYKIDQILYVKPSPGIEPHPGYPAIGSSFETDVKVMQVSESKFGSVVNYSVIIPGYGQAEIPQDKLVLASERHKYKHKDFRFMVIKQDLKPFFSFGETVMVFEGHVHSLSEETVVKLNEELSSYLIQK